MTNHPTRARASALASGLRDWNPLSIQQAALRDDYLGFVETLGERALERDAGSEHVTASCFIFSPDLAHVLLCFHKKGRFWVQLGGHIESDDDSVPDAAMREAEEESGLGGLRLLHAVPADLNRHELASSFGRCRRHWDLGYAAVASADTAPVVSDESEDVAWWRVDALPEQIPWDFPQRIAYVLEELKSR